MRTMKVCRQTAVTLVFLVCCTLFHPVHARGPSTPEERAKVIELTRMLERDPLNENADASREWLREWTREIPEIRFHVCSDLLSDGLEPHYPYLREINLQTVLSGAVFTLERQDRMRDDVGAYIAGVEGSLRMYEVLVRSRPDARSAFLDDLIAVRGRGGLADHIAARAAERCPRSDLTWVAAVAGTAVGLGLGWLAGWLFGGPRSKKVSGIDDLSGEKRLSKFSLTASWIVFACAAYYVIAGAALHFLKPEYDPRYRFMSEYAWSPHGWLMTTTFFVLALALFTVAFTLRKLDQPSRSTRLVFGVLVVGAVFICIAGIFRGFPLHDIGSAVGLTSVVMAALVLSWTLRRDQAWRSLFPVLLMIALGMLIALGSMILDVGMPGLQQRIFLFLVLVWLSLVAHRLAQRRRTQIADN